MKAVIRRICDEGSFFELKPNYARNIVTGFGRLAGIPVGVLANAPMRMAGGLTPECCLSLAWPGAEIGFMDPPVAANVLFEPQIKQPAARRAGGIGHHSFGDSSFFTGMSDYVVQLTGACLA